MTSTPLCDGILAPLSNFERDRAPREGWSLTAVDALVVGRSCGRLVVQVGGSKGKGTTAHYLESLARAAGLRTGLYTSPHLQRVTERVRIDGVEATDEALAAALQGVLDEARRAAVPLSYFEAMTVAAHRLFGQAGLDLVVFEVGLGGRFDATTAIPVDASILTMVELEHVAILGADIPTIATEKSFVIRAGRPAFTAATGAALGVFERRAAAEGSELWRLGQEIRIRPEQVRPRRERRLQGPAQEGAKPAAAADLAGELQVGRHAWRYRLRDASHSELLAMALARACLHRLAPDLRVALDPVCRPVLPGRFEVRSYLAAPLILDGAHTVGSLQLVADELRRRYSRQCQDGVVALFATAADKDYRSSLMPLLDAVDSWFVTGLSGTVAEDPQRIAAWLQAKGCHVEVVADAAAGLARLRAVAAALRLVTGSFYLVGAVRTLIDSSQNE